MYDEYILYTLLYSCIYVYVITYSHTVPLMSIKIHVHVADIDKSERTAIATTTPIITPPLPPSSTTQNA